MPRPRKKKPTSWSQYPLREAAIAIAMGRIGASITQTSIPRTRKKKPNPWTPADVKAIRSLAGKQGAKVIGRKLKRTEGAVRQQALVLGVSLRIR